jgi:hypothetical protein
MTGMTPGETGSYIHHHLQLAAATTDLFSDAAQIHQAARGKPPHRQQPRHRHPHRHLSNREEDRRPVRSPRRDQRGHLNRMSIPPTP